MAVCHAATTAHTQKLSAASMHEYICVSAQTDEVQTTKRPTASNTHPTRRQLAACVKNLGRQAVMGYGLRELYLNTPATLADPTY
jgi:hypothetical protein